VLDKKTNIIKINPALSHNGRIVGVSVISPLAPSIVHDAASDLAVGLHGPRRSPTHPHPCN